MKPAGETAPARRSRLRWLAFDVCLLLLGSAMLAEEQGWVRSDFDTWCFVLLALTTVGCGLDAALEERRTRSRSVAPLESPSPDGNSDHAESPP
jgi:hypothetical protein